MNTTEEWWDINGTSLNQHGWNIVTVGGARYDLPTRRGDNMVFAYRPGSVHRAKLPDARTITLVMWVAGVEPSSGTNYDNAILRWNDNWDFLRRSVWRADGSQLDLTRRWNLTVSGTPTLVTATAKAEIADAMEPTMTGRTRADFAMTFLLADPYFYGTTVTETCVLSTPKSVVNPGHDFAMHNNVTVTLTGPLTNPRLTNTTATPDVWVQYTGSIPTGDTVVLTVGTFVAVTNHGVNVINNISHSGARFWMGLLPGTNSLTLTATAGTGSATVAFQPPYV